MVVLVRGRERGLSPLLAPAGRRQAAQQVDDGHGAVVQPQLGKVVPEGAARELRSPRETDLVLPHVVARLVPEDGHRPSHL